MYGPPPPSLCDQSHRGEKHHVSPVLGGSGSETGLSLGLTPALFQKVPHYIDTVLLQKKDFLPSVLEVAPNNPKAITSH